MSSSKIRIAHILYSFGTGGLEKGIATLARNSSEDIEHIIVCLSVSGASEKLLPSGVQIVELHKAPGNSPAFLWKLSRTIKSLCPSVVHTRNWSGMDGIIAARMAGIGSIVHGEHGWGMEDPDGLNSKRILVRRFLRHWVREYTCVSKSIESWLKKTIRVKRPVSQIYNGVDIDLYSPTKDKAGIRQSLGLANDSFLVGIVGRLDPIKNHSILFQAIETVRKQIPKVCLVVAGDGPERDRLEREAGRSTVFLGNRADVPELLRALDLFVLPSLNEGISNTILEAMASGLPVAATRVGGNPELVLDGSTGRLLPPCDPAAIVNAIMDFFENPTFRDSCSRAARDRIVANFGVDVMVEGYERVYRRVAAGA